MTKKNSTMTLLSLLILLAIVSSAQNSSAYSDSIHTVYLEKTQSDTTRIDTANNFMKEVLKNKACCDHYIEVDSLNQQELILEKQKFRKKSNIYKAVITALLSALMFTI